ncbi:MAG: DUF92 domain-containing protein [Chloroflexi bacterium]|jgi:uncharacterized protein (TIGR00297 family)|nr:DUF92 domain-containing protein [Chloroflexota bacterium]MBT3668977.1 DUF92 domain-containing protein [Chloroflexota bacterium]MBT4002825.1 DUF92 domain-containing protein [Chloroflexota bacterium]MBT4304948.1 DUF92 domain-containing protein [Chloroflexota bacterium]MBT4533289.1 DUF92 domain-containing protein [Chloroflexota bacterium]
MEIPFSLQNLIVGFAASAAIGLVAWRMGALAISGAFGATMIGGLIFGFGGLSWAAILLTFFISSSVMSKLFAKRKLELAEKFSKGSKRDWGQVLANGGVGVFIVVIQVFFPETIWPFLAFAGAFATVNGDTWATELGVLSAETPRLISNRKAVPRGTSGGVTWAGTMATIAGAGLIGFVAILFEPNVKGLLVMLMITLGGLAGATMDSFLGATIQAIYYDPVREKETEKIVYDENGETMAPIRGWDWMNNDMVNFLSSIFGALITVALWQIFS